MGCTCPNAGMSKHTVLLRACPNTGISELLLRAHVSKHAVDKGSAIWLMSLTPTSWGCIRQIPGPSAPTRHSLVAWCPAPPPLSVPQCCFGYTQDNQKRKHAHD